MSRKSPTGKGPKTPTVEGLELVVPRNPDHVDDINGKPSRSNRGPKMRGACVMCKLDKLGCDKGRPCQKCVQKGREQLCADVARDAQEFKEITQEVRQNKRRYKKRKSRDDVLDTSAGEDNADDRRVVPRIFDSEMDNFLRMKFRLNHLLYELASEYPEKKSPFYVRDVIVERTPSWVCFQAFVRDCLGEAAMFYVRKEMIKAAQAASVRDPSSALVLRQQEDLGVACVRHIPSCTVHSSEIEFTADELSSIVAVFGAQSLLNNELAIRILDITVEADNRCHMQIRSNKNFEQLIGRSMSELGSLFMKFRGNPASPLPPTIMYAERSWKLACEFGIKACLLEQVSCLQSFFLKRPDGSEVECVVLFLNQLKKTPRYISSMKMILKPVSADFNLSTIPVRSMYYTN
jgi:hypothetical protein